MLREIYLETLRRCAPERLVARVWRDDFPRNVVAIGKCAGTLRDGIDCDDAFVAIPEGYRAPVKASQVVIGGHPHYTTASFEAGEELLRFVDAHDDITFLISGGGSACVEVPLAPRTREQLASENAHLIASGLPIGEINAARKAMSAIKGGRLAQRLRGRCVTLVYSDVSRGALADVASGPTIPGSDEVVLIADNDTLVDTACEVAKARGFEVVRWPDQIECDVEAAAQQLAAAAIESRPGQLLVAGGEPTIVVHGNGKGGRCTELAVRFCLAMESRRPRRLPADEPTAAIQALFASSDGVDGNSGAAGVEIDRLPASLDRDLIETELGNSNSSAAAFAIGRAIMIPPAGNNLRDLYLLARG